MDSNKRRGWDAKNGIRDPIMMTPIIEKPASKSAGDSETLFIVPAPPRKSNRFLKPLWRDLILKVWGGDPMRCPCCKATMKNAGKMIRKEEIEFFLRLHGMWEGIISLPPPPDPPYDIETMEPIAVPPNWGWSDEIGPPPEEWWQSNGPEWQAPELPLDDGNTLVLDAPEPLPPEEFPVFFVD